MRSCVDKSSGLVVAWREETGTVNTGKTTQRHASVFSIENVTIQYRQCTPCSSENERIRVNNVDETQPTVWDTSRVRVCITTKQLVSGVRGR